MKLKKLKAWLPAVLWMGVIFAMSAAPGDLSGEQSGLIVRVILSVHGFFFGEKQLSPDVLALLETLVRKAAHMSEYAVLALLFLHALRSEGARHPMRTALLLCALYAASDEIHQAFVPDRGPSPVDVLIDTAGACIGLALSRIAARIRRNRSTT